MNDTKRQFQIYLPGLLKVLAESLYSTKKVAVRELLQNAHDSCVRRSIESKDKSYKPRVDVWIDPVKRTLTIQDNGSGLTAEEAEEYLSTIGRSYTRQLGENLSVLSPEQAEKLIGQFGLGFLSAFLMASEVTFTTKSMKDGNPMLQWRSSGDIHYDLVPVEGDRIGSTVELQVKSAASFILNEQVLIETIQQYADFLPIPIYVRGHSFPVNALNPPWEAIDPQIAIREYVERAFNIAQPLAIISIEDQVVDLGHDQVTIPLKGFLFIPPSSVASIHEYGDLSIYIRHMFICERQRNLLPSWAKFVRGVIDCPYLQPTASREEIQQDDNFLSVQQALEQQLVKGLRKIANEEPKVWKQIVRGHADVLMGWAVQDNEFFTQVADMMTFRTSRGQMSLPDYLKETDHTLYYVTRELGSLQERVLGEGYGVPVIDASWFAVGPFLRKYALQHEGIELVQLDGESGHLLRQVAEEPFAKLLQYYRQRGVKCKIVMFKPDTMPAIVLYPKDAEFIVETRQALDAGELPGPFAGLVSDYLNRMNKGVDEIEGTLYLNAESELIRYLAELADDTLRSAALTLIYQIARLFSGRMLDTDQVADAFRETAEVIQKLVIK